MLTRLTYFSLKLHRRNEIKLEIHKKYIENIMNSGYLIRSGNLASMAYGILLNPIRMQMLHWVSNGTIIDSRRIFFLYASG